MGTIKTIKNIPFKGRFRAATPSISQNMPLFHRSNRDYSELSFDLDKNMLLIEKSIGTVIGAEFSVIRECLYAGFNYEKGELNAAHEYALIA
jgi:hypothetical protein